MLGYQRLINLTEEEIFSKFTLANFGGVESLADYSVICGFTVITVDALSIVFTVLTDAASLIISMNIQRKMLLINVLVVDALV